MQVDGLQFLDDKPLADVFRRMRKSPWFRVLSDDGPSVLVRLGLIDSGRPDSRRLVCTGLIVGADDDEEVTSRRLRTVQVASITEAARQFAAGEPWAGAPGLEAALMRALAPRMILDTAGTAVARPRKPAGGAWSEAHYREVADLYRSAEARGLPPAVHVEREWPASPSTARRWIAEARRRGFLEAWTPRPRPGTDTAGPAADTDHPAGEDADDTSA